ncbi:MAG TPA: UDP-glucose 4-epimerase GalE [Candidatus Koribacter sp.]|jgi:UDP-glucose 4-epimerase
MKVLVTGGAGYIGSAVVHALRGHGDTVVVYDNLSNGHREAIPHGIELVVGDVGDRVRLAETLRVGGFDGVLHFAASIEVGESMITPERFFRNNTANTITLLELLVEYRVTRLVFSSTAALYGNPQRTPIAEDDPLKATNPYGESKLLVEQMLNWFHRIHGLRFASLRYFNAAGATADVGEDHNPESHLIPIVLQAAAGARPTVSIYGADYPTPDGSCVRDYIHIFDLAEAHVLALHRLGTGSEPERLIFNLGNGNGFSVREVIAAAEQVTGKKVSAQEAPRRAGDPAILVASSEKIRQELGWKPKFPQVTEIIESAWKWRLAHPNGYGS